MVLELLMPDNDCDVWNNDNDSDDDDEDKTETIAIRMREEGSAIVPIRKWAGFMTATEQSVQMLTRKNWRKKKWLSRPGVATRFTVQHVSQLAKTFCSTYLHFYDEKVISP